MRESTIISDAEWEIMRIVWAEAPVTSTAIIKALESVTGWMPTTVKTLLARLVTKGILRYEKKGRTFYYEPLMTEEQCIRDEMKNVVEKVYGGTTTLETPHFRFKGHYDEAFTQKIAEALEDNYLKITKDLGQAPEETLLVYTHATQKRLHSALGLLEGPKWLRAGHLWDILHIAPMACFEAFSGDVSGEKAAVHTFTQLLVQKINPMAPYWLQQAVALYESQWMTKERIQKAIREILQNETQVKTEQLTQMQQMRDVFLSFKEQQGYELGYTVAEYMVQAYGVECMAMFVRRPYDFQGVFGVDENAFWTAWHTFLETNYQ